MSDMVETMAYNKVEVPWHGLGNPVNGNLTPEEMMKAAGVDWEVQRFPAYITLNGKKTKIGKEVLVRMSDYQQLSVVSNEWKECQNRTAFDFIDEFCKEGSMTPETAGSLCGGELVWLLAKINESFALFRGKDQIDGYLLFVNPHRYGWSISTSLTPIRVVCWNTLTLSLRETKGDKILKVNHRKEFVADEVKKVMGLSKEKLKQYQEAATFLTSKTAKGEDIVDYFKRIFPMITKTGSEEPSKAANTCLGILNSQPGAELGAGTWWGPYNAVTYYADDLASKTEDTRVTNSWFGEMRKKKIKALELACEMAKTS